MSSYPNEPVMLSRDVEAVIVPAGTPITLKAGLGGFITQALGGSFTLYIEGNLYRIPGVQADAIGKEVLQAPRIAARRHRGRRARTGLGADAQLLRSGDPRQHRRPGAGVRLHGHAASATASARSA